MEYIHRNLEDFFKKNGACYPALLLTGPRQVGKTTFLKHISEENRNYVTLDIPRERTLAAEEPELFLERHKPPVLIDEIQYAPELLPYIKVMIDREQKPGMFWLTGSQQFHMMGNVTESLAGRVGVFEMLGLSNQELNNRNEGPFLPQKERQPAPDGMDLSKLYRRIWNGGFPRLAENPDMDHDLFYGSYVNTYLERDVRILAQVGDLHRFFRFLRAAAARTGQLLNYADLARDADVSVASAKNYLSILTASGLIALLEPYFTNQTKRMTQTPKLYFLDTGLCAYLTDWSSPETLEAGAMSGHIFETWCVSEILKSYRNAGKRAPLYFYRDFDQAKIDLVIEQDGILYPVEIKKSTNPGRDAAKNFAKLEKFGKPVGKGAVICMVREQEPLTSACSLIPAASL